MSLFTQTLDITRYGEQVLDEYGNYSSPEAAVILIQCSIQPTSTGDKVNLQAQGKNVVKSKLLYTPTELIASDQFTQVISDTTIIDGREYEVFGGDDWDIPSSDLSYYSYYLIMREQGHD